jgi:hypothetical protein
MLLTAANLLTLVSAPLPSRGQAMPKIGEHWLTGRWQAQFALDSTWRLAEPVRARQLTGPLRFEPVAPDPAGGAASRPVHAGTFSLDFAQFGFQPESAEALGWYEGPDSVRIVLNPVGDHGVIELVGTRTGDSVTGRWTMTGDPSGARGRASRCAQRNRAPPNHRLHLTGRRGARPPMRPRCTSAAVEAFNCVAAGCCPQLKRGSLGGLPDPLARRSSHQEWRRCI